MPAARRARRRRRARRGAGRSSRARARADEVLVLVGSTSRSKKWCSSTHVVPTQNGSASPGSNGWRMTGTSEPGMKSSRARRSGGASRFGKPCSGIVDHRFDHIDSGKLSPDRRRGRTCGAVGDLHPVAVDPADRPVAHRRRRARRAAARATGRGCACSAVDAEHVGDAWRRGRRWSSARRTSSRRSTPGQCDEQRDVAERLVLHHPRLAPDVARRSRRGSGRGRCTR